MAILGMFAILAGLVAKEEFPDEWSRLMTWASVVLAIKTFFASVPRTVYTHGLAFVVGFMLRGCLALAVIGLLLGTANAAGPCPIVGPGCQCGCVQGGSCNCAAEKQEDDYRDLSEWAAKHPGKIASVYVHCDPPTGYAHCCRYDAGWPDVKTATIIQGTYRDGQFVEVARVVLDDTGRPARPAAMQRPLSFFAPFSGACRS